MILPAPEPALRVSVTVPAKNEENLIGRCLLALAAQVGVRPQEYEVLLVLDGCTDATEERAREVAARHPDLRLHFLRGPGIGVGFARRTGMEAACSRLHAAGRPDGLVASTDADSVVAPDWISSQIRLAERGAEAIGGRILLECGGSSLPEAALGWYERQAEARFRRVLSLARGDLSEHWQFSGASLSLRAGTYRRIGGLPSTRDLEDEGLERALEDAGVGIYRSLAVRVTTSARTAGRASRGLAHDLAAHVGNGASPGPERPGTPHPVE